MVPVGYFLSLCRVHGVFHISSSSVLAQFLKVPVEFMLSSYGVPVQFLWSSCTVPMEFLYSSEIPNGVHLEFTWSSGGVQVESMQMCG